MESPSNQLSNRGIRSALRSQNRSGAKHFPGSAKGQNVGAQKAWETTGLCLAQKGGFLEAIQNSGQRDRKSRMRRFDSS